MKLSRILTAVLCLSLIMGLSIPAFAANRTDVDFRPEPFSIPSFSYEVIDPRRKDDSSPVYLCISQSNQEAVRVQALGYATSTSLKGNYTLSENAAVEFVYCYRGTHHVIHTMINENGCGYANLGFASTSIYMDTINGWWSPDSQLPTPSRYVSAKQ